MAAMAKNTDRSTVMNRSARRVWLIGSAIALMVVGGAAIVSCGDTDETPLGEYSEPCENQTQCAMGLTCLVGICSQICGSMAECRGNLGEIGRTSVCIGGVCQEPCEPTDFNQCPNGLTCRQSSAGSSCLP
jgi:hypothetical protein